MLHDFRKSLEISQKQADAPWWERVYRAAFADMASMEYQAAGSQEQLCGIDRVITLRSGKQVTVDEKVRTEVWPDILLERWSDRERRRPGWIQKGLYCDYLAYAFVPTETCYLFPFQTLRRAWQQNGKRWCKLAEAREDGFAIKLSPNRGYVTENVAVPIKALEAALCEAMVIRWSSDPPPRDDLFDLQWGRNIRLLAWHIYLQPGFPVDGFERAQAQARVVIQSEVEGR